jgi:hypothetical protein
LDHVVSGKWLRHLHLHVHQEHENTGETNIFKRSIVNDKKYLLIIIYRYPTKWITGNKSKA